MKRPWVEGACRTNGVDLHYLRTGGAKPPLVALHGLTGDGAIWTPLARALEGEWDVVMPDARGHGKSSAPARGYAYDDHVDDIVGLVGALGLDAPVLLGHSMGGMTAALAASRPGADVRAVVLVDPSFLSPERLREVHESDVREQHRRLLAMTRKEALADASRRHHHRSREMIELVTDARLRTPVLAFDVLMPPNPDYRGAVAAIRAPVLLIVGENGVVSPEMAHDLRRLNRGLRYEVISGAGHGLPYDRLDALAAVVAEFLKAALALPNH